MQKPIMLAAGGTGGHLFPAFALAEELGRRGHAVELMTDHRAERYGADFPARAVHYIASATLSGRSPGALARTGWTLARGTGAAARLLRRSKPAALMGFGGYPTFPPLLAARLLAIPRGVHEQNAVLGRANRMLARHVNAIATSFENTLNLEGLAARKIIVTGNPVRHTVIDWGMRAYRPPEPGGPFRLVVFGGSQGARYFSDAVPPALARLPDPLKARLHIVQQCRPEDLERVGAAYRASGIEAELSDFFSDLPERMANSHLVIARAGASTVSEITVLGRPSLLVPLPHSLDNDQLYNATRLAEGGGGWCIEQRELGEARLAGEIETLAGAPGRLAEAAAAASRMGRPDAVIRLADVVEGLAGQR